MIIDRVLNNNVVIIKDKDGLEQVVCGKGIAFKKKSGDFIDDKEINKVFILKDKVKNKKFQEIVSNIPLQYLEVTNEIIEMIKLESGKKISDTIYISLSDHIHMAVERFLDGIAIKNYMMWDIKRFYPQEFQLSLNALDIIKEKLDVTLPQDEAAFITLHIVNAGMDNDDMHQTLEITKIMQEISNIVRYYFSIEFDTDSVYYYRFITHLKFFAERLLSDNIIKDSDDDDLLNMVKIKYKESFSCVEKITEFISRKYEYKLSKEEQLYLTIHIERVVNKNQNKE